MGIVNGDFEVSIARKGGGELALNDAQSFYSIANWLVDDYSQDQKGNQSNWQYNTNGDSLLYLENFRFNINDASDSLENYDIYVQTNTGKAGNNPPPEQMWLAIGDTQMQGDNQGGGKFKFDLSDGQIKHFIDAYDSTGTEAIKQFTIQPYDKSQPGSDNYFGKRFLSVSVGPETYNIQGPGEIFNGGTNIREVYTNSDSQLKPKSELEFNVEGTDIQVQVGSFADWLLRMDHKDGPSVNDDSYSLVIDNAVDINQKLLSQQVLWREPGFDSGNWQVLTLNNSRKIAVTATKDGVIDGTNRLKENYVKNTYNQFQNAMLNLQASQGWNGQDGSQLDARSIAVAGVTFKNPPKRNESTIQLNNDASVDWYTQPTGDSNADYSARIKLAIDNAKNENYSSNFFNNKGNEVAPVWMFDNRLIGGWVDGSDGFEVRSPLSYFERNTIHTTDDSIKVGSNTSQYLDTTVYQGHTGAAINLSDYGEANGPITNNRIDGTWVHRAAQLGPQFDRIGGLISNKTTFGDPLTGGDWAKGQNGIYNNTINRLFVPSFFFGDAGFDANAVNDTGILSALKNSAFPIDAKLVTDQSVFSLGGNSFDNINIASSPGVTPLLYAFGTQESPTGANQPAINWDIAYSGETYNLDGNNIMVPYPGSIPGGLETINVQYEGLSFDDANYYPWISVNLF